MMPIRSDPDPQHWSVSIRSLLMLVPFFKVKNFIAVHSIDKMINSEVLTTYIGSSSITPSHDVNSMPSAVSILQYPNLPYILTL